ncbi:MAG: hypothetical protein KAS32_04500, partial [Candidatus Peribacteraceae bacterium]|nr:hypothetical protein [Candidatus Peribacteraceae bacterium]
MAGGTIYARLSDLQSHVVMMKSSCDKFLDTCESFEQWAEYATGLIEKTKNLHKEAVADNRKEAGELLDKAYDILLEACDRAPKYQP